jgi:hypothetical protein
MSLNPAVPAAWHYFSQNKASIFGTYTASGNREFDFYKTGGGGSLALGKGKYVGMEYNLRNENNSRKFHRATISYGSLIDDNFEDDPLFIGANISFCGFNGSLPKSGLLPIRKDTVSHGANYYFYDSFVRDVKARYNAVSTDLGFYQSGTKKVLSWGITLENILGCSWTSNNPHLQSKLTPEILLTSDSSVITINYDSTYYEFSEKETIGFLNKKYNDFLLAANVSLPFANNKVLLMVPLDLRFWGFMNKDLRKSTKLKHRTEVHSGAELQLNHIICGRFGWAWIPEIYKTFENGQLDYTGWKNHFSGGLGINIKMVSIDMFFTKDSWGGGLSFQL